MSDMSNIVEVRNLKKYFPIKEGILQKEAAQVHAVDGVTFSIGHGESLGLVGESGSGKSTTGRCILGVLSPTEGEVVFMGEILSHLPKKKMRKLRKFMAVIFQDPYSSLNPRWKVENIISEPITIHRKISRHERREKVRELLDLVGLEPYHATRYPYEFSGGQKQRIAIARALAANPKFVVADEPTAALDASVKAGVLNLMKKLGERFDISFLFISHDLGSVNYVTDRIAVMYAGRIMEIGPSDEISAKPVHPYTRALMSVSPVVDPSLSRERIILSGDVPNPVNPPVGCRFYDRCYAKTLSCKPNEPPPLIEVGEGHWAACHCT